MSRQQGGFVERIPFNVPYLTGKEQNYVTEAIQSRAHCGNRGFVQKSASFIETMYGFKRVFLTPSASAALEMGAILANLQPGDEVIMPSWTFSSTANCVVLRGAKPVFCEIDPTTSNIDVSKIEALITPKTKMLLPIDYAGVPCDIDAVMVIAKKHGLLVMLDAAQSMHAKYRGDLTRTQPDFVVYSFHETKNITCGEGGALCLNNSTFIDRAEIVQEKGTDRSMVVKGLKSKYCWADVGSSFLLSDILAAFLLAQLEDVEGITLRRKKVWDHYIEILTPLRERGQVDFIQVPSYAQPNYHGFFIQLKDVRMQTDFLNRITREYAVNAYIGYFPLHSSDMGLRLGYSPLQLPITETQFHRLVRLPFYAELDEKLVHCGNAIVSALQDIS
jgi:dTDP-4-amino-4,6-dideoxygalactose transaminase